MPGGNKRVAHTWTNLYLSAAVLFKYVWPFCYHQALEGQNGYAGFWEIYTHTYLVNNLY